MTLAGRMSGVGEILETKGDYSSMGEVSSSSPQNEREAEGGYCLLLLRDWPRKIET